MCADVRQIEYKGKGYFGGKSHQYKALLYPPSSKSTLTPPVPSTTASRTFEGLWHLTSKETTPYSQSPYVIGDFTDVTTPKEEVTMLREGLDEMDEWESRRLWRYVAKGIREGDFEMASREKSKIENEQRQRRKDEVAEGKKWEWRHFERVESDPVCESCFFLFFDQLESSGVDY